MEAYVVGFKVFDGRSFQTEDNQPCDPFVVVECCGSRFQTACLEQRAAFVPWNESCIWPAIELHPQEFESAFVEFKVYARHWFTRNYLIGKASLQLSFINKRGHHLYARRWLQLRREETTEITGFLNVTVFCLRPGEEAPTATQQEMPSAADEEEEPAVDLNLDDLRGAILTSKLEAPQGEAQYVVIDIHRVDELRQLPQLSGGGPPSPYVSVEFAGSTVTTEVAQSVTDFTFNARLQIPVVTPIYEDTIIIKIWTRNWYFADELLAQGLISFAELRNKSLPPRWFPLYGWNTEEIGNLDDIIASGVQLEPNYFTGRLLVSGRVKRLDPGQELMPAAVSQAQTIQEPPTMQLCILADVYMAIGASGRKCCVEVGIGAVSERTKHVFCDDDYLGDNVENFDQADGQNGDDAVTAERSAGNSDKVVAFSFKDKDGRVPPILTTCPQDPASQPQVMISVYTEHRLESERRVGVLLLPLNDFPDYDPQTPARPKFYGMKAMPHAAQQITPPAVLLAVEKHSTDDVFRHPQKPFKPMLYIVRAYCFMARNINYEGASTTENDSFSLRVACAGISKSTEFKEGPRPYWMKHMDLKVVLFADSTKEDPTIEPVVCTLVCGGTLSNQDLGKASCTYRRMRKKTNQGKWDDFRLTPQWIRVYGGTYGKKAIAEVLIAFELIAWKHKDEIPLQPRDMYPKTEHHFNWWEHFCLLRRATLHISLYGLRDLMPLGGVISSTEVKKPHVVVTVPNFEDPVEAAKAAEERKHLPKGHQRQEKAEFVYQDLVDGGDKQVKKDRMKVWKSRCGTLGETLCQNFEFFQTGKLRCLIPDTYLMRPYVIVKVEDAPSGYLSSQPTLIGESRQSLATLLPCCWMDGVSLEKPFAEQEELIREKLDEHMARHRVNDSFKQESQAHIAAEIKKMRQREEVVWQWVHHSDFVNFQPAEIRRIEEAYQNQEDEIVLDTAYVKHKVGGSHLHIDLQRMVQFDPSTEHARQIRRIVLGKEKEKKVEELVHVDTVKEEDYFLDDTGVAQPLRMKQHIPLMQALKMPNMQREVSFSPRRGETTRQVGAELQREVYGKLEEANREDFFYRSMPLLKNTDVLESTHMEKDWNYQPGLTQGFVKCAFMLVDGWESDREEDEAKHPADGGFVAKRESKYAVPQHQVEESDIQKLKRSYFIDERLHAFAFNQKDLQRKFKGEMTVNRLRCQMFFMKAVCIFGKGSGFADPYIDFQLGPNRRVSMRNIVQPETNTPEFYRMEEHEMVLPDDSRLEIRIMDKEDTRADQLIGSTVIDLEDRWHSKYGRTSQVPKEKRSLYTWEVPNRVRGNIEMWVTVFDSTDEVPSTFLQRPPDTELEVRFVIWTTSKVKMVAGDYVNVKLGVTLDCQEYLGDHPATQYTDEHYNAIDGNGVFNWRIVYPRIKMPVTECAALVNLYHHEALGDTFIGSLNLDLKKYMEKVARDGDPVSTNPSDLPFVDTTSELDEPESFGSVAMSLYVLTYGEARNRPAGMGREEPNVDPTLSTPSEGRGWDDYIATFNFSLPDFGFMKKLIPVFIAMAVFLFTLVLLRQIGII